MTEPLTPPTAPWAWPFFDEVHRDVAARLVEWMRRQQVDETDDRRACRQWVQLLGKGQWLGPSNGGLKLAMQTLDIFCASVAGAATGMARRALGVKVGSKVESLYGDIRSLCIDKGATDVQQLIIGKAVLR